MEELLSGTESSDNEWVEIPLPHSSSICEMRVSSHDPSERRIGIVERIDPLFTRARSITASSFVPRRGDKQSEKKLMLVTGMQEPHRRSGHLRPRDSNTRRTTY